uniref:Uncharacterized protein n=1 Tax=Anguilla anguilla TaxID=7936 RepID=A0A0E9WD01_ANGAN
MALVYLAMQKKKKRRRRWYVRPLGQRMESFVCTFGKCRV